MDEQAIFIAALERDSEVRRDYLDEACAGNPELRRRVERLLAAHEDAASFLDQPAGELAATAAQPISEKPGTVIGPYKLLQQIGEGGMGVVYMAEQTSPVKMRVALKIIKPGMDSKQVIARFETERQALALMEHPNIAKVLAAGTTESGRPYFAMELVKGEPITTYCDKHHLTLRERLRLIASVCSAVQHAHQKGIIHRDLKPSNVLIARYDGKPVAKVIDFGVAKATGQQLTEKTLFTQFGQVVGTLEYMSPEQAEFNQQDIDTRSDIYSLGILLYQLLTGTTPFDPKRLRSSAWNEAMRIIREEEPPRPSVRVSSTEGTPSIIAENRNTEPGKLMALLRGDLDWLVMKALAKERERRYETASAFAADIERYLDGDAIEARPPSTVYRLRKTAGRHRVALATTAVVMLALATGTVVSTWMAILLRSALREVQEASMERAYVAAVLGDNASAETGLKAASDAGASNRAEIRVLQGMIELNRGDYEKTVQIAQELLDEDENHIGALALLVSAQLSRGQIDEWGVESNRLAELVPRTDIDRLLMAHALVLCDSGQSLRLLAETEQMGRSPLGLLLRGQDCILRGEDTQDLELFQQAVRDFEYVHFLLPDNPEAIAGRLGAIAHAIEFSRSHDYEYQAFVDQGHRLLEELSPSGSNPFSDLARWKLCRALGDTEGASAAIQRAGQHGIHCWYVAVDCLTRHDSSADAERAFDDALSGHENGKYPRLAKAYIVHDLQNGAQRVGGLVNELTNDRSAINRMLALCALCLAGDLNNVQNCAVQGQRQNDRGTPRFANGPCLDFLANPFSAEEKSKLLKTADLNGYASINAHFTIGMTRLAAHDREGAIKEFEECTATTAIGNLSYEIARVFLFRMKADSAWPGWLQDESGD